ncbi:unnamed protein product [Calypogeia fissa]
MLTLYGVPLSDEDYTSDQPPPERPAETKKPVARYRLLWIASSLNLVTRLPGRRLGLGPGSDQGPGSDRGRGSRSGTGLGGVDRVWGGVGESLGTADRVRDRGPSSGPGTKFRAGMGGRVRLGPGLGYGRGWALGRPGGDKRRGGGPGKLIPQFILERRREGEEAKKAWP